MPPLKGSIKAKKRSFPEEVCFSPAGVLGEEGGAWNGPRVGGHPSWQRIADRWEPATPFRARLEMLDLVSGDGPTRAILRDPATDRRYTLALPDLRDLLLAPGCCLADGHLEGQWGYVTYEDRFVGVYRLGD